VEAVSAPTESQPSWLPALPHVLTAAMANFMFGYHIGYDLLLAADGLVENWVKGKRMCFSGLGDVQSDEWAAAVHCAGAEVQRRHDHRRVRTQHIHRRRFRGKRRRQRPR
jgi:hypothetical protein